MILIFCLLVFQNGQWNKVYNYAQVSIVIFIVNLSVLFWLRIKKSLSIKKDIALEMFLRLHTEHKVLLLAIEKFYY